MAQHATQRPIRARLAIGTGLLAAGMLLVAPAATAFAGPGRGATDGCNGTATLGKAGCNKSGGTTGTGVTATTTGTPPMSHHPCAQPAKTTPSDSGPSAQ
jgi:hypothetical protein